MRVHSFVYSWLRNKKTNPSKPLSHFYSFITSNLTSTSPSKKEKKKKPGFHESPNMVHESLSGAVWFFVFLTSLIILYLIFVTHHLKYPNFPNPLFDTLTHHPFFNFKSCSWVSPKKKKKNQSVCQTLQLGMWVKLWKCHWKLSFGNQKHLKYVFSFHSLLLKNQRIE